MPRHSISADLIVPVGDVRLFVRGLSSLRESHPVSPLSIALLSFVSVCAGALLGLWLRERLPEHHLSKDSQGTLTLFTGLLATLSGMVLGVTIGSAKGAFDDVQAGLQKTVAQFIHIDRLLAEYGDDGQELRRWLKTQADARFDRILGKGSEADVPAFARKELGPELDVQLSRLKPADDEQRQLLSRIQSLSNDLRLSHWMIVERASDGLPPVFLVVVVSWLTLMFLCFGLFAPRNPVTLAATVLTAAAVATAILLVEELYRPLDGLISIPPEPLRQGLDLLGR